MSFLSYRTKIPRHFDSHASVRSTTQRRGFSPLDRSHGVFSSPIRRMWGVYLALATASRPVGLSYPLSRQRFCGRFRVGTGRSTTMLSIVSRSILQSGTFAPSIATPNGPPSASTNTDFLVPFFPRSVGFLPTFFPPEPGLAQLGIRTLPFPIHGAQLVALGDEDRPDRLHDPAGAPALEPVVDGALGAELAGELFPLAT